MKRALTLLSFGMALALVATPLLAGGDSANGKTKAAACFACHGADGNAVDPQYPRLAGREADQPVLLVIFVELAVDPAMAKRRIDRLGLRQAGYARRLLGEL